MRPKSFMENEEILYGNLIFLFSVSSMSNKTNLFNYIHFKLNRSVNKLKSDFSLKIPVFTSIMVQRISAEDQVGEPASHFMLLTATNSELQES